MADTIERTSVVEAIHNHHQEILDTFAGHVNAIVDGAGNTPADPSALVAFLKGELLPHAQGEEAHLYPAIDPLVREYGSATSTMKIDHEYITTYIEDISAVVEEIGTASKEDKLTLQANLQRLCLQLEAVLVPHLDKEERVYIPLFEKYVPVNEQERILDGMHDAYEGDPELELDVLQLDVRLIAPRERHGLIFDTYAALGPGEAFILINDHDPKPLYYQFSAEHPGEFTWEYLEKGPITWKVEIGVRG